MSSYEEQKKEYENRMKKVKPTELDFKLREGHAITKERDRMMDELHKENVDMEIIQKVTGARMSYVIGRKIKILEEMRQVESKKEHQADLRD